MLLVLGAPKRRHLLSAACVTHTHTKLIFTMREKNKVNWRKFVWFKLRLAAVGGRRWPSVAVGGRRWLSVAGRPPRLAEEEEKSKENAKKRKTSRKQT